MKKNKIWQLQNKLSISLTGYITLYRKKYRDDIFVTGSWLAGPVGDADQPGGNSGKQIDRQIIDDR